MLSRGDGLCGRWESRAPARRIQMLCEAPVRAYARGQDSALSAVVWAQDGCARAVAEDHARRAVFVINVLRQDFRTDDESIARLSRADHRIGERQAVEETGTCGGQIE